MGRSQNIHGLVRTAARFSASLRHLKQECTSKERMLFLDGHKSNKQTTDWISASLTRHFVQYTNCTAIWDCRICKIFSFLAALATLALWLSFSFSNKPHNLCLRTLIHTVSSAQNAFSPFLLQGTPTQSSYLNPNITSLIKASLSPQIISKKYLKKIYNENDFIQVLSYEQDFNRQRKKDMPFQDQFRIFQMLP